MSGAAPFPFRQVIVSIANDVVEKDQLREAVYRRYRLRPPFQRYLVSRQRSFWQAALGECYDFES